MTTRLALLDLVARARLDERQAATLLRLAGLDGLSPRLLDRTRLGITLLGAACAGLGVIFWVAANWGLLTRWQQFALLQTLVIVPCAVAATYGRAQAGVGMLTLIATGGLFAYFGQTYQTGADPWQLFALWAALGLPLAWCTRSDAVWSAWAVVAMVGIMLWERTNDGYGASHGFDIGIVRVIGTICAGGMTVAFNNAFRPYTGAGTWAYGTALVLTTAWVTTTAVLSLGDVPSGLVSYWFAVFATGGAMALLAHTKPFSVFSASILALSLNILLVMGMGKAMVWNATRDSWIAAFSMLGLLAAGLLAASVSIILSLQRASTLPVAGQAHHKERV
jgi:uncharacterized membrane protein